MKRTMWTAALAAVLALPLLPAILTNPTGTTFRVGDTIGFMTNCNSYLNCNWYWGDGTSLLNQVDDTYTWRNHAYRNPGSYTVHVHRVTSGTPPTCGLDEYLAITISEDRSIAASPSSPIVGQTVTFTASNFNTPGDITWNMGDGTTLSHRGSSVTHAYAAAGSYAVRAYDWSGDTAATPVTRNIAVAADNRSISFSPANPAVGQVVTFTASNFNTPGDITWVMGDGTTLAHYGSSVTHAYAAAGSYTVRAYDWNGNANTAPVTRNIAISTDSRWIGFTPANPVIGQTVTFTASNFYTPADITWDMGDSTFLAHRGSIVTHAYAAAGSYTVRAYDGNGNTRSTPVTQTLSVSASDRSLSAQPAEPVIGQTVTFTASNFYTPADITWDMGDGTTLAHQGSSVAHAFARAGDYTIRAYDWNGNLKRAPVSLILRVSGATRLIVFDPALPRVDQPVDIRALHFRSAEIDWNFGDNQALRPGPAWVSHRYQDPGNFVITASEHGMNLPAASRAITILPENRSLELSAHEARSGEALTVTALNFRGPLVRWNFGDGSGAAVSGPPTMTHAYGRPGTYTILARDEDGASEKVFSASLRIIGINDDVNLEIAEITLDNGKYYQVVPRNSRTIRARLRMKMRGTGIVSGYWIIDGRPSYFFNETAYQGQVKTIFTPELPGLPTFDPGAHTITLQLTRPASGVAVFPTLRYFVLPFENTIALLGPDDGAVLKEDEAASFTWERALGGSRYQIAFFDSLFAVLRRDAGLTWHECPEHTRYAPDPQTWGSLGRDRWTYWQVRAVDGAGVVVAESGIRELKVIVPGAKIGIRRIRDMDGRDIAAGRGEVATRADRLLLDGTLTYPAAAEYLVLRVVVGGELVDQLLFRDVRQGEERTFETSVANPEGGSRVIFEVLKSSSPSVRVGYEELRLRRE